MTTQAAERVWSYTTSVDLADSLSSYLKFLKSKPRLDEIFFYLQSTYLLDYGFDSLALYSIDLKGNLICIESTGEDVLAQQGRSSLAELKKIIPPTLPTQAEPITECILSYDECSTLNDLAKEFTSPSHPSQYEVEFSYRRLLGYLAPHGSNTSESSLII
jgi:hypothetical protein